MAGKKVKKTKAKELTEAVSNYSLLIDKALDEGVSTKSGICKLTGLQLYQINNIFQKNKELFAKFKIIRGTMADKAADNLSKILDSPGHPSHFAATKYVLQTYKTDLDDSMVEKKGNELEIETGKGGKSPIKIRFGK
jgi:ribosomal protein L10